MAEAALYMALHRKLAKGSGLSADGECEEFEAWRQQWSHLFGKRVVVDIETARYVIYRLLLIIHCSAPPNSEMLRISFYAAHLILVARSMEDTGDGRARHRLIIDTV